MARSRASSLLPLCILLVLAILFLHSDGGRQIAAAETTAVHAVTPPPRAARGASEECERTYGFMPCTTTVVGNLFLVLTYGFLMYKAATHLSAGSELLLAILGPGIIGGLLLPLLGALPDALLILVSGLSGNRETAQSQVVIGIGLLAGSTVMLLTLLWGSCVVVGKCDLSENSTAIDSQDTRWFSLRGSGVTTDLPTRYAARIMLSSVIPFFIVQLPRVFKRHSVQHIFVLISLIAAVLFLLLYCLYQVLSPWIQKRKLEYVRLKHIISGMLKLVQLQALEQLFTTDGRPNIPVIQKLFHLIDSDADGKVSLAELKALIVGIEFDEIELGIDDAVSKIMRDFDTSQDATIDEPEFIRGMTKWLNEAKRSVATFGLNYADVILKFHEKMKDEHKLLSEMADETTDSIGKRKWTSFKAVSLLVLGTLIAAAFADPLVDAVHNFSIASRIPSFFISFLALPLATNSSEAVSAIIFASKKRQKTASLTFSEVYGGATMNNVLCLAVFLALVYFRHLNWDFSAEVLVILIVCIVMGLFTSFRTTFKLWTCLIAFLLYPLSLGLVYILDYHFGWS